MVNKIWHVRFSRISAVRFSILSGFLASLLLVAPQLSAQISANPSLEIFTAPGTTVDFHGLQFRPGLLWGASPFCTLGAPNLDFTSVPAGTTCPNVVARSCNIEVQFQPTAPGRRQGMVVLNDPSGNVLLGISLDGAGSGAMAAFGPGMASTFAGGGSGGDGGPAMGALLAGPTGITVDGFGNHYIADQKGNKIRKVTPSGNISTFAGTGSAGIFR